MKIEKEMRKKVKGIGIVMLVLGIVLLASGCGKDGSIYGSLTWDYIITGTIGGFPSGGLSANVEYQVSAGTWEIRYYIFDGTYYWPGGSTSSPTNYWDAYYTVSVDKGSFPFVNGTDSYFELYLSEGGVYKAGSVKSIQPAQGSNGAIPTPESQTWTQGGLIITVTNKAVAMNPDVLSELKNSHLKNK